MYANKSPKVLICHKEMFVNKIYFESLTGRHVLRIISYSTANLFTCRSAAGGWMCWLIKISKASVSYLLTIQLKNIRTELTHRQTFHRSIKTQEDLTGISSNHQHILQMLHWSNFIHCSLVYSRWVRPALCEDMQR